MLLHQLQYRRQLRCLMKRPLSSAFRLSALHDSCASVRLSLPIGSAGAPFTSAPLFSSNLHPVTKVEEPVSNVVQAPCLNISAYKFVPLPDAHQVRDALYTAAHGLGLRGTVLLAEEGINLFLAGEPGSVREWVARLRSDSRFSDVEPKESFSTSVPFRKLLVKVKREIIRMNMPAIQPAAGRAPALPPATLARWLQQGHDDDGVPVVMLDTRNGFEVDEGAFDGAIDWRLTKFSDFPDALRARASELAGRTVVSYCTGGIRCEKAAIVAQQLGIERVWQLDGGILKYLETTDAPGWHGQCFVFDERRGVDAQLRPQIDGAAVGSARTAASSMPMPAATQAAHGMAMPAAPGPTVSQRHAGTATATTSVSMPDPRMPAIVMNALA